MTHLSWDPHEVGELGADHPLLVAILVLGLIALLVVSVAAVVAIVTAPRRSPEPVRHDDE
ncbi:hypothetical protein SAMN04489860_0710 [Paraoerskovia marina]|uniref:Uncharacterized protein n=1 Tax=Paraoerskovia marina TaxID=545619 RepID=A0A1H1P5N4_9CELL|nr:hypothetical protein [Paraoerskovia marina]SDS06350.1 hypothetical protein SAMN04489860_0710 [Paraoerskovia marina]